MMPNAQEINWWIDHTGSTHTNCVPSDPSRAIAVGTVYLESKSGVIALLNNKPANLALISRELLDVLYAQFPGTRWWVKDADAEQKSQKQNQAQAPKRQAAS